MNSLFTFLLGLLFGWFLKWLIDPSYGPRRFTEREAVSAPRRRSEGRLDAMRDVESQPVVQIAPDNLKVIKGIGPVIERKLNEGGIYTFDQLGKLTSADLRRILGKTIERLADEEFLLQQARDLARGNR